MLNVDDLTPEQMRAIAAAAIELWAADEKPMGGTPNEWTDWCEVHQNATRKVIDLVANTIRQKQEARDAAKKDRP